MKSVSAIVLRGPRDLVVKKTIVQLWNVPMVENVSYSILVKFATVPWILPAFSVKKPSRTIHANITNVKMEEFAKRLRVWKNTIQNVFVRGIEQASIVKGGIHKPRGQLRGSKNSQKVANKESQRSHKPVKISQDMDKSSRNVDKMLTKCWQNVDKM